MATNSLYAIPAVLTPGLDVGPSVLTIKQTLATTAPVQSGDLILLATFPKAGRAFGAYLNVKATLGTSCTLKLSVGDGSSNVDLTGATTAGAASKVNGNTIGPIDFAAGANLYATIGGAAITAGAAIEVDVLVDYN